MGVMYFTEIIYSERVVDRSDDISPRVRTDGRTGSVLGSLVEEDIPSSFQITNRVAHGRLPVRYYSLLN